MTARTRGQGIKLHIECRRGAAIKFLAVINILVRFSHPRANKLSESIFALADSGTSGEGYDSGTLGKAGEPSPDPSDSSAALTIRNGGGVLITKPGKVKGGLPKAITAP